MWAGRGRRLGLPSYQVELNLFLIFISFVIWSSIRKNLLRIH